MKRTEMDAVIANILRLRACQAAVLALFAAIIVTNVDINSLIVGNEPTRTTRYPYVTFAGRAVAHVTSPPALIPSIWSKDPIKASLFDAETIHCCMSSVNLYLHLGIRSESTTR